MRFHVAPKLVVAERTARPEDAIKHGRGSTDDATDRLASFGATWDCSCRLVGPELEVILAQRGTDR